MNNLNLVICSIVLMLIVSGLANAVVPSYKLDDFLADPCCIGSTTSVDLSPDGTKICAQVTYDIAVDEGHLIYDADTYELICYCPVPNSAYWAGLVTSDSAY